MLLICAYKESIEPLRRSWSNYGILDQYIPYYSVYLRDYISGRYNSVRMNQTLEAILYWIKVDSTILSFIDQSLFLVITYIIQVPQEVVKVSNDIYLSSIS